LPDIAHSTKDSMFGSGHPQPPHRKEVAMQIVRHEQKSFDKTLTVEAPGGPVAMPPDDDAIRFDVAYTLEDYLGAMRDHVAFLLRQAPPARRLRATLLPLAFGLPALAAAWLAGPGWLGGLLAAAGLLALACLPFAAGFWVLLIGTPVFWFKQRRMPYCAFRIDGRGIERSRGDRTLVRAWSELDMVRRYRRGYLLVFARGAVPIPFRCMNQHQQEAFRRLILSRQ
jgi:hypothetical protein